MLHVHTTCSCWTLGCVVPRLSKHPSRSRCVPRKYLTLVGAELIGLPLTHASGCLPILETPGSSSNAAPRSASSLAKSAMYSFSMRRHAQTMQGVQIRYLSSAFFRSSALPLSPPSPDSLRGLYSSVSLNETSDCCPKLPLLRLLLRFMKHSSGQDFVEKSKQRPKNRIAIATKAISWRAPQKPS